MMNSIDSIEVCGASDLDNQHLPVSCDCHSLKFIHWYSSTRKWRNSIWCDSGCDGNGIASIVDGDETEVRVAMGYVDDDLNLIVEVDDGEETINRITHEAVLCHDCYADQNTACCDYEIVEDAVRNDDDRWVIRCTSCHQHVDFEWANYAQTRIRIKAEDA